MAEVIDNKNQSNIAVRLIEGALDAADRIGNAYSEFLKPQRESLWYIRHNLGAIATGKVVLVPVSTELLETRVLTEMGPGTEFGSATRVEIALHSGPINVGDLTRIEEFYNTPVSERPDKLDFSPEVTRDYIS